MSKKIKCYNCGRECEVTKCSCGAEDWQCVCGYGSGHLCNILKCKKERYCIKNGKLYDKDVFIGYISEYQAETYVSMLNYLDEQLAEKDKEIERLKQCVMSREQVEAIMRPEISNLAEQITKEITPTIYKECCYQICKKIKEKITQITGLSVEELKINIYDFTPKEIFNILDQIEKGE